MWFGSGFGEHLLHMDEAAESPVATLGGDNDIPEEDKADSGDDDQMLDWSKLGQKASKSNRSLPKRGEKAFEPIATGPSAYQKHTLDLARRAMYDVLSAPREIQTKRLSQAIWIPTLSRAHIVENRGSIFNSLGYTIRRPGNTSKRLELLPEETLYLIERGSMLCWKEAPGLYEQLQDQDEQDPIKPLGTPMSVQQCFTDMLGVQDTTMERYQVYSYLKRFGYIVRRAQTLTGSPEYTIYRHPPMKLGWYHYFQQRINIIFSSFKGLLRIDWWARFHPSVVSYWKRALHYPSLFKSFRVLSTQRVKNKPATPASPYKVFFQVWKPESPWNRIQPSAPDFEIVVINARTTPIPTIYDLEALYDTLPPVAPTLQTQRFQTTGHKSIITRLFSFFRISLWSNAHERVNVFATLKGGRNTIIIAVVDAGTISMYRFNEGCFEEWPMV